MGIRTCIVSKSQGLSIYVGAKFYDGILFQIRVSIIIPMFLQANVSRETNHLY